MESVFYLFPVKEGLSGSFAHKLLQRAGFPKDEDHYVTSSLISVYTLDDELRSVSRNIQSFYFSENVAEFCNGINKDGGYPAPITLIRKRFIKQMTDATALLPDAGSNCSVYEAPVLGKDYFARIVACKMSGIVVGTVLCALYADSGIREISVKVANQDMVLDERPAEFVNVVDWLTEHHHPSRVYESNQKHDYEHRVKGGDIASKWPYDDTTSQSFLNQAFVDGKRLVLCWIKEENALVFDEHTQDHFHGHVDDINIISNSVRKLLARVEKYRESQDD